MPVWPQAEVTNMPVITPFHNQAAGQTLNASGAALLGASFTSIWPTANKAFIFPLRIRGRPWVARQALVYNGSAVSGTIDVGIYDWRGNKIISTGAVTQSGTSAVQSISITATTLQPGRYWMALSVSNTTSRITRHASASAQLLAYAPAWIMTSAHPLPDPITFTPTDLAYVPLFGLSTLTV